MWSIQGSGVKDQLVCPTTPCTGGVQFVGVMTLNPAGGVGAGRSVLGAACSANCVSEQHKYRPHVFECVPH